MAHRFSIGDTMRCNKLAFALPAVLMFVCAQANAQPYPNRPIKLVVPLIAGSPVDALARVATQQLQTRLGQNVVIDNRPGAGGTVGARAVATAEADGYTLLFPINGHLYGIYSSPGYDPIESFTPVAAVANWSHVLIVRPDFPAKTLKELVEYAKANPGKVTFGFGSGTPPQILGETLKKVSGADINNIPYRGGAQAVADLLGGRIDMNFGATSTLLPLIQKGQVRAIAFTGTKRSPDLPDVPTVAEAGFPQMAFNPDAWAGIVAPAGTPPDIIKQLNAAMNESLKSPEIQSALVKLGYEPSIMTPEQFGKFLRAENEKWPPLAKAAGLKAE